MSISTKGGHGWYDFTETADQTVTATGIYIIGSVTDPIRVGQWRNKRLSFVIKNTAQTLTVEILASNTKDADDFITIDSETYTVSADTPKSINIKDNHKFLAFKFTSDANTITLEDVIIHCGEADSETEVNINIEDIELSVDDLEDILGKSGTPSSYTDADNSNTLRRINELITYILGETGVSADDSLTDATDTDTIRRFLQRIAESVEIMDDWDNNNKADINISSEDISLITNIQTLQNELGNGGAGLWSDATANNTIRGFLELLLKAVGNNTTVYDDTSLNNDYSLRKFLDLIHNLIDTWNETNRAAVNIISGEAGVSANSGILDSGTQRVSIATDDLINDILGSGGTNYDETSVNDYSVRKYLHEIHSVTGSANDTVEDILGDSGTPATFTDATDTKTLRHLTEEVRDTIGNGGDGSWADADGSEINYTARKLLQLINNSIGTSNDTLENILGDDGSLYTDNNTLDYSMREFLYLLFKAVGLSGTTYTDTGLSNDYSLRKFLDEIFTLQDTWNNANDRLSVDVAEDNINLIDNIQYIRDAIGDKTGATWTDADNDNTLRKITELIYDNMGVTGGEGVIDSTTQRITIATDDDLLEYFGIDATGTPTDADSNYTLRRFVELIAYIIGDGGDYSVDADGSEINYTVRKLLQVIYSTLSTIDGNINTCDTTSISGNVTSNSQNIATQTTASSIDTEIKKTSGTTNVALTYGTIKVSVATPGTAVQFNDGTSLLVRKFAITPLDNTNDVYVGDSSVDNTYAPFSGLSSDNASNSEQFQLNELYLDADVASDGVQVHYWT